MSSKYIYVNVFLDISCLPCLKVSDIERYAKTYSLDHNTIKDKIPMQLRFTPTNGVSYFKGVNSINALPQGLLQYLPIFADALTELGTTNKSIDQFQKDIQSSTGGLSVSNIIIPNHSG